MVIKNVPEPEISYLRTSIIIDRKVIEIQSNVEDLISCEDEVCAKDIFETYIVPKIEKEIHGEVYEIIIARGGKVFVYMIDGKKVYLVIHRRDIDPLKLIPETQ